MTLTGDRRAHSSFLRGPKEHDTFSGRFLILMIAHYIDKLRLCRAHQLSRFCWSYMHYLHAIKTRVNTFLFGRIIMRDKLTVHARVVALFVQTLARKRIYLQLINRRTKTKRDIKVKGQQEHQESPTRASAFGTCCRSCRRSESEHLHPERQLRLVFAFCCCTFRASGRLDLLYDLRRGKQCTTVVRCLLLVLQLRTAIAISSRSTPALLHQHLR